MQHWYPQPTTPVRAPTFRPCLPKLSRLQDLAYLRLTSTTKTSLTTFFFCLVIVGVDAGFLLDLPATAHIKKEKKPHCALGEWPASACYRPTDQARSP